MKRVSLIKSHIRSLSFKKLLLVKKHHDLNKKNHDTSAANCNYFQAVCLTTLSVHAVEKKKQCNRLPFDSGNATCALVEQF